MVLLIDFDSIIYTSVYKIVGIASMRDAINKYGKQGAKQWILEEVYNEGINKCENQLLKIQNYIDEQIIDDITAVELFITTDKNSFRKKLSPIYKVKRRENKYVWMIRDHYQINNAKCSDTLEADDLIAIRARELGKYNCVIVSIDKDLKQIGGFYWSYYKIKSRDSGGDLILNEFGFHEREYKQKLIEYISEKDSSLFFWSQMLTGDSGDGIKGLYMIGAKKAEKILSKTSVNWFAVAREYIKRNQKEDFKLAYKLLKIG